MASPLSTAQRLAKLRVASHLASARQMECEARYYRAEVRLNCGGAHAQQLANQYDHHAKEYRRMAADVVRDYQLAEA